MADNTADHPWHDESLLREMYYDQKMGICEIGEELGCAPPTVRKWMNRFDLPRRSLAEARAVSREYGKSVCFYTREKGYEIAHNIHRSQKDSVYIHRLLAVAEFGFDAVSGIQVHHKNHIPWDNRAENIELMDPSSHQTHHLDIHYGNKPGPVE